MNWDDYDLAEAKEGIFQSRTSNALVVHLEIAEQTLQIALLRGWNWCGES